MAYHEQFQRLRQWSGCDLLQMTFGRTETNAGSVWKVAGIEPFPQIHDPLAIQTLAQLLEAKALAQEPVPA